MKKKDAPKIVWHKTEETGVHDWEGYIRIPFDKEYAFTIQMDDNGYLEIDNQKVVELKVQLIQEGGGQEGTQARLPLRQAPS